MAFTSPSPCLTHYMEVLSSSPLPSVIYRRAEFASLLRSHCSSVSVLCILLHLYPLLHISLSYLLSFASLYITSSFLLYLRHDHAIYNTLPFYNFFYLPPVTSTGVRWIIKTRHPPRFASALRIMPLLGPAFLEGKIRY